MFTVIVGSRFKKDAKKYQRDLPAQEIIIKLLQTSRPLPPEYREHQLIGNYVGYLECHGRPDLLLIYQRDNENKQIKLYRVGSHSALFK